MHKKGKIIKLDIENSKQFFEQIVIRSYNSYKENRDIYNIIVTSILINNCLEWIFKDNNRDKSLTFDNFRDKHNNNCEDLSIIRDICDASKHFTLGRVSVIVDTVRGYKEIALGSFNASCFNSVQMNDLKTEEIKAFVIAKKEKRDASELFENSINYIHNLIYNTINQTP